MYALMFFKAICPNYLVFIHKFIILSFREIEVFPLSFEPLCFLNYPYEFLIKYYLAFNGYSLVKINVETYTCYCYKTNKFERSFFSYSFSISCCTVLEPLSLNQIKNFKELNTLNSNVKTK